MKTFPATYHIGILTVLLAFVPLVSVAGESDIVRLQFPEVDTLLVNPGQGWMSQQRSPRTEPRFPCSVVYVRFNWGDAEPEQGRFNCDLNNHVSLINDNIGRVPPEAMPQLEKLARLAGARSVLRELKHEKSVQPGDLLNLRMKWAHVGVGKLHRPHALCVFLLDTENT